VVKDAANAKIYRLDMATFDRLDGQVITWENAVEIVPIPPLAQGGVFDEAGNIWLSASTSQIGALYRLDRKTGKVLARYEAVPGIEGISFDGRGKLWAISEAGARKYMHWKTHFPVIFEIDVARLK
jgi:streptogramin lyase